MYNGAAGLGSHAQAMGVISDNIANVNTVGFRSSRANFTDVLGGVLSGSRMGAGSMIGSVQTMFNRGSLVGTGNATDLAIDGSGFFMVAGEVGGISGNYFTRAGQFQLDDSGSLVSTAGLNVQGYGLDATGGLSSTIGNMQIDTGTLPPTATANVSLDANLDAAQAINPVAFDINDPGATSDYQTSATVYDSLGNAHQLTTFFKKIVDTPTAQWEVHVTTAGADVDPAVATAFTELAAGTLSFDTNGALSASTLANVNVQWTGAAAGVITLNLGTPTGSGGTGVDGVTSYAGASAASAIEQDGVSTGELSDFEILSDGTIEGLYSNGQTRTLGQIATATFTNIDGLQRQGNALFRANNESGNPLIGTPGSGGLGSLVAGSLEGSNVDLAQEFVTMIAVQRGFQSNSRTISTADEMMTEINSLKR